MQRVETATAVAQAPTLEPAGTPGFFTKGDPVGGLQATIPGQDWFNTVQEELVSIVEGLGGVLDRSDSAQIITWLLSSFANVSGNASQAFKVGPAVDVGEAARLEQLPARNLLVNGGMAVNQEASSYTLPAGVARYTLDMHLVRSDGGAAVVSQEDNTMTQAREAKMMRITGADGVTAVAKYTRIESVNAAAAKGMMTWSVLVMNGSGGQITPILRIRTANATDDFSAVTEVASHIFAALSAGEETRLTYSVDLSAASGCARGIEIELDLGAALTSGTIDIAEEQINPGPVRTEFEHVDFAVELARCQRYSVVPQTTTIDQTIAVGMCTSTTTARVVMAINMRTVPTLIIGSPGDYRLEANGFVQAAAALSVSASRITPTMLALDITASGLALGQTAYLLSGNTSRMIVSSRL